MPGGWLSSTVVAAGVSAAVCAGLHYWGALPVRATEVPPIDGLGPAQAREVLAPRELLLVLDGELPDVGRAGALVQQRPLAGSQVARGSAVHAFVAARPVAAAPAPVPAPVPAPAPVPVPVPAPAPVPVPVPVPAAAAAPAPVAPARAPERAAKVVPAVVGKRLPVAREAIQRAGFLVGDVRYGNDTDVGPERVLRQQPAAGTAAPAGTRIDLVVNEAE